MFKAIRFILGLMLFQTVAAIAAPPEINIAEGEGYTRVTPAQPTAEPAKIEVIEFFWYGCPHCLRLEPAMTEWLEKKPADVHFIRQPAVFGANWAPHARAFFTAQSLGIVDKIHDDMFKAVQVDRRALNTEDQMAKFFAEHGVEDKAFRDTWSSFIVDTKMRQAGSKSARYRVTGVPAVIINGKYKTNESMAQSFPNMIIVMNYLIDQERP